MTNFDLLDYVQPSDGFFCVLGIKGPKDVKQKVVATRAELDGWTKKFVQEKRNVFYNVAKLQTIDGGRVKENVSALKSFWLDIDCGPTKAEVNEKTNRPDGYISQAEGLRALKTFCDFVGLPLPTIVDSGRGIHAYWVLTEEVSREDWEPVAARLRNVCLTQNFYVDPVVFEVSRILRVPETYNFKDDPPKKVQVRKVTEAITFDEFKEILGVEEIEQIAARSRPKRKLTAIGQAIADNMDSSFAKIMLRQKTKTSCQQLIACYKERDTLSEPRWFDALSVAKFCSDKSEAIHKLSAGHPDYDPDVVEKKIEHILGPHSCEVFERNNPGGCDGCPHRGAITSPISLGKGILRASAEDNLVSIAPAPEEPTEVELDVGQELADPTQVRIPEYPAPFFRGKNGGIYLELSGDDDDGPKLVYENDLYVEKRMNDPELGDVAVFKLHTPKDGLREFVVPNAKITELRELRKELSKYGVMAPEPQFKLILQFVISSIKELQHKRKAEVMRVQFGWADNDSKFIVGNKEITRDGTYHTPPASVTQGVVEHLHSSGTLEKWKEVFALYDRPGLEVQAFAALSGFGAPLLKFTGQKGAIINMIHRFAGTGKTTVLRMANSICGHPEHLLGTPDDTSVGRVIKLGLLNNIVNTFDEITNMKAEAFSEYAYAASQGRGKDKAEASTNKLRVNNTTWRTITLASANSSFYQKLTALKDSPDGEMMRLLEFRIDYPEKNIITTQEGKDMFDHQLNQNYGVAIEPYARYLVGNLEDCKQLVRDVQAKIDARLELTQRERNWSAVIAANIAGGIIARRLGLISWDIGRILNKITPVIKDMRAETKAPVSPASSIVGDYVNRWLGHMLIVDDGVDKRTNKPKFPIMEPKGGGGLKQRYEPDTKKLFIPVNYFRKHCVDAQIDYQEVTKELQETGIYLETINKRLSKGMGITSKGVRCLVLDCSNPDFIEMDSLAESEDDIDDSREGDVRD